MTLVGLMFNLLGILSAVVVILLNGDVATGVGFTRLLKSIFSTGAGARAVVGAGASGKGNTLHPLTTQTTHSKKTKLIFNMIIDYR